MPHTDTVTGTTMGIFVIEKKLTRLKSFLKRLHIYIIIYMYCFLFDILQGDSLLNIRMNPLILFRNYTNMLHKG